MKKIIIFVDNCENYILTVQFKDVIGHEDAIRRLRQQVLTDRLPHALMLSGPQGTGKMALALALARLLVCKSPTADGEPCEACPGCRMSAAWTHPDLHFSFPVIKKKATDQPVSDDFLEAWREQLLQTPYFSQDDWLRRLGGENEQMQHFVGESDALQRKLSLKSSQGGRRVVVQWLPEKMPEATANKLLKLIEEPPSHTHFILVSDRPDAVLGTIQSRTQRMHIGPLGETEIAQALVQRHGTEPDEARHLAHLAQGSMTRALKQHEGEGEESLYLDIFISLMRLSYMRQVKEMRAWTERVAALGRERQKHFLQYCQRMIRENFILNFGLESRLNYMTAAESRFSQRFAPFINERNVIDIMEALSDCERDIEQNVQARMVFFDFSVKLTILLK